MTIKEICEASGLTKKAVAYYEEKGLICPDVRENGYREYRKEDVQTLREVACLRFYGLTVAQIRQVLESGDKAGTITALLVEKEEQLHWQKNCLESARRNRISFFLLYPMVLVPALYVEERFFTVTEDLKQSLVMSALTVKDCSVPAETEAVWKCMRAVMWSEKN